MFQCLIIVFSLANHFSMVKQSIMWNPEYLFFYYNLFQRKAPSPKRDEPRRSSPSPVPKVPLIYLLVDFTEDINILYTPPYLPGGAFA